MRSKSFTARRPPIGVVQSKELGLDEFCYEKKQLLHSRSTFTLMQAIQDKYHGCQQRSFIRACYQPSVLPF